MLLTTHVASFIGAINGCTSPSVLIHIRAHARPVPTAQIRRLIEEIHQASGIPSNPNWQSLAKRDAEAMPIASAPWLKDFASLIHALACDISALLETATAGQPSFAQLPIEEERPESEYSHEYLIQWPCHWPARLAELCNWVIEELNHRHQQKIAYPVTQTDCRTWASTDWPSLKRRLGMGLPHFTNTPRLLKACSRLGIPVQLIRNDVLQLGWGRGARWMQSTATDLTPMLGVQIAKNKAHTNQLMRFAGLPTPRQAEVTSSSHAIQAANAMGYPVVLKPSNLDGGLGAFINLKNAKQIESAYAKARKLSQSIVIEQQLHGREFRLTVVDGKLFWAHERIPAQVEGNGTSSLEELIGDENQRRRSMRESNNETRSDIQLNADDISFIEENGRTLSSVPAPGETVRLQRVPIAFRGGEGQSHSTTIHPDNQRIAERAAQLLRLDLAGIDLIMPDLSRSWRDVGGAITEVNALPQISTLTEPRLLDRLLETLIPTGGRIPVLTIFAETWPEEWLRELRQTLAADGFRLGTSSPPGLVLGEELVHSQRRSPWQDVRTMQANPCVDMLAVTCRASEFSITGLPFDRFDVLILDGSEPEWSMEFAESYPSSHKLMVGKANANLDDSWQSLEQLAGNEAILLETTKVALLSAQDQIASARLSK